jgi:hypothetical protein
MRNSSHLSTIELIGNVAFWLGHAINNLTQEQLPLNESMRTSSMMPSTFTAYWRYGAAQ